MSRPVRIEVSDGWYSITARGLEWRADPTGLGQHVGADYPAVSKAILRMKARLGNDPAMRKTLTQTKKEMSKVRT